MSSTADDSKHSAVISSGIKIESGIQMLARLTRKPGIDKFYASLFGNGPKHGDFIEFNSEGNTIYLLTELICEALMLQKLNGPEAGILIFSTDGNFNFGAIINVLRNKIIKFINNASIYNTNDIDALLKSSLKNLYILEIFDSTQFHITIQNMENLLSKHPNISLVVFHTLTAFYWSEQDFKITKMDSYLRKLLSVIQKIIKDHKIVVMYSKPESFSKSKEKTDSLKPCCQNTTEVQIKYRIQVVLNESGSNFINVRNNDNCFQKEFNLINEEIVWLQ
ncbi:jg14682 [Pararge aegeria aegeria]|uniref:Jg14682 protein n=1 Tax=Pararge aegeria aegeria TaxID=348720 RepID=A0A8S4RF39_9NEOP|nr:jg14682 [Pararge aegeria aegeria]